MSFFENLRFTKVIKNQRKLEKPKANKNYRAHPVFDTHVYKMTTPDNLIPLATAILSNYDPRQKNPSNNLNEQLVSHLIQNAAAVFQTDTETSVPPLEVLLIAVLIAFGPSKEGMDWEWSKVRRGVVCLNGVEILRRRQLLRLMKRMDIRLASLEGILAKYGTLGKREMQILEILRKKKELLKLLAVNMTEKFEACSVAVKRQVIIHTILTTETNPMEKCKIAIDEFFPLVTEQLRRQQFYALDINREAISQEDLEAPIELVKYDTARLVFTEMVEGIETHIRPENLSVEDLRRTLNGWSCFKIFRDEISWDMTYQSLCSYVRGWWRVKAESDVIEPLL